MSKDFCSSADPTGFLGRRIYSGRKWKKSSSFSVKSWGCCLVFFSFLRAVASNRLVSLLFYVHVSTTLILCLVLVKHQQFLCCNFKTGGELDCLLLQLKYSLKKRKQVCMTFMVFRDRGSVGPSKNWRLVVVWGCVLAQPS